MENNPKQILKVAGIIHWAMLLPMTLFGGYCYYLHLDPQSHPEANPNMLYIPMVLLIMAILLGKYIYTQKIKQVLSADFKTRMQAFLTAIIIRGSLYEVAGLSAGVMSYISESNTILLLIPIIWLQFKMLAPSISRIKLDLQATEEELSTLV